jgi:hypothetical protein
MAKKKAAVKKKATTPRKKAVRSKKTEAEKKQAAKEKRRAEALDVAEKGPDSQYYRQWLRSSLRRGFKKWPSYYTKNATTRTLSLKAKDKAGRERWMNHKQCEVCKGWFTTRDLNQDHILPAGSLLSVEPEEVGQFVLNLYCSIHNLRYVCDYTLDDAEERFGGKKSCHYTITHGNKGE